jgi:hypothetical protein
MIKHNNSLPEISLGKLKRLKQAAKKLSKETGQSHSSALDCIARREGYPNWKAVLKADKTSRHLSESTPGPSLHFAFDEDVEMSEDDTQRLENERARELPKDAKLLLAENRSFLVQKGVEHSIFETTLTGLQKSILDATQPVRAHFKMVGFHDYNDQAQGEDHKVTLDAYFLAQEKIIPSQVSMYRPQTKKGDPRMWFRGLGGYAPAGSQVAVIILDGLLHLINLTDIDLDAATKADNPLSQFILRYTDTHQETAKELLAKLKEIAKQPLPALGEADNAIGMAVEAALGIEPNSSKEPDYKGIEIKSGRGTKSRSNLFAQVADWRLSSCKSSREILENYGYERGEDFKLYCTVSTQNFNSQGLTFEYRDANDTLLEKHSDGDDVAIWKGDKLRERLCEKHAETFWVQAETEVINGVENFHLKSVVHTKSPLANQLMPLIASGVVTMDHLIKRTGGTKPKLVEKGPIFKIQKRDLSFLFPSPEKYSLTGADE